MREIFECGTCSGVLRDAFESAKRDHPQTTLAVFAASLGLSTSGLHMLLSGKRKLTAQQVQRLARALRMSPTERDYLDTLFLREQADDDDSKRYYDEKLSTLAKCRRIRRLRRSDKSLLASWRLPALLVYLWDRDGSSSRNGLEPDDMSEIARRLGVSEAQLSGWLSQCRKAGLIDTAKDGQTHVILDGMTRQLPQKSYLRDVLAELARRVDRSFSDPLHLLRAFTFSIEPERLDALRADLGALFESYMVRPTAGSKTAAVVTAFVGVFPALMPKGDGPPPPVKMAP
jgi:uncharacterized protein (TIGR02147 family)